MAKSSSKSRSCSPSNHSGMSGNWSSSTNYHSGGGRGTSSHPGPGGNWPSTTGNPSGGGRGNGPAKGI